MSQNSTTVPTAFIPSTAPIKVTVMMLQGPPIDKLVALALMCDEFRIDPSDPQDLEGLYIVFEHTHPDMKGRVRDIDVTTRYHGHAGSATEVMVRDLGYADMQGMDRLVADINSNNNGDKNTGRRGGWIKRLHQSFAWLVREAYTFPHGKTTIEDASWRAGVIKEMLPVVAAYIKFLEEPLELDQEAFKAKRLEFSDAFPELENGPTHPLTLSGQAWYRFAKGETVESIQSFVDKWLGWFKQAGEVDNDIVAALNRGDYQAEQFTFDDNRRGILVQAEDPRVTRAIFRNWEPDLVVVRRPSTGNIAILPSSEGKMRNQLVSIFNALDSLEPGCWYREDRVERGNNPRILNGSTAKSMPASKLGSIQILDEINRAFGQ